MMSVPRVRNTTPEAMMVIGPPELSLRLGLKPQAPTAGYVDGAWWPRSRELSTELPALLAALAVRLGPIARVSYHLAGWDDSPRPLYVDGGRVYERG